jgi:putative ubiquitin-RnfH superfamily antitoxin RatB of RatAB toxin-antitoxin module
MIRVLVAIATPQRQEVVELQVAEGTNAAEAIALSGLQQRFAEIDFTAAPLGIWSRPCGRDTVLREGDRLEVYRELRADPKEMRRKRARLKPSP